MVNGIRKAFLDRAIHLDARAGDEQPVAARDEPLSDGRHLLRRLALAENDLGEALAQGTVMIQRGEAQVFVGKVSQALESFVDRQIAVADRLQQLFQPRLVDSLNSLPADRALPMLYESCHSEK